MFFNIFTYDLLFQIEKADICNYANDTTLFTCDWDITGVISRLENDSALASKWFCDNYMRLNEEKCNPMTVGNNHTDRSGASGGVGVWHPPHGLKIMNLLGRFKIFSCSLGR